MDRSQSHEYNPQSRQMSTIAGSREVTYTWLQLFAWFRIIADLHNHIAIASGPRDRGNKLKKENTGRQHHDPENGEESIYPSRSSQSIQAGKERRGPVWPAARLVWKLAKSQNTCTARASYYWGIFQSVTMSPTNNIPCSLTFSVQTPVVWNY